MYITRTGKQHFAWKGNKVSYFALHNWIYRILGKANHCDKCGLYRIPKGKKRFFQWSSKTKKYSRNLKNWWQLCIPCHLEFDGHSEFMKGNDYWKKTKTGRDKVTGQFISLKSI